MQRHLFIVVLAWLFANPAQAQPLRLSRETESGQERLSPHYYTVRNLLRNYRFLKPQGAANGLIGGVHIPTAFLELGSDVTFEDGTYEFAVRVQGSAYQAALRKRDGRWLIELIPDAAEQRKEVYVLER